MSERKAKVNVTPAKGRPMLTWVGKRPLSHVTVFPTQLVEYHDALKGALRTRLGSGRNYRFFV